MESAGAVVESAGAVVVSAGFFAFDLLLAPLLGLMSEVTSSLNCTNLKFIIPGFVEQKMVVFTTTIDEQELTDKRK